MPKVIFCTRFTGSVFPMPTLIVTVRFCCSNSSVTISVPDFCHNGVLLAAIASTTWSVSYICSMRTSWRSTGCIHVSKKSLMP